jgi:hypothetical protein
MDINTGVQQDSPSSDEKGYLQVWGGDALTPLKLTTRNWVLHPGSMC